LNRLTNKIIQFLVQLTIENPCVGSLILAQDTIFEN